jgi:hypothetical protein
MCINLVRFRQQIVEVLCVKFLICIASDLPQTKSLMSSAAKYEIEDMSMLVDAFMDDDMSDSEPSGSASVGGSAHSTAAGVIDALIGLPDSGVMPGNKAEWVSPKMKSVTVVSVSNSNTIHWAPTIKSIRCAAFH